jgi:hypothetical protein
MSAITTPGNQVVGRGSLGTREQISDLLGKQSFPYQRLAQEVASLLVCHIKRNLLHHAAFNP